VTYDDANYNSARADSTWYHIVWVAHGDDDVDLYLDGTRVLASAVGQLPPFNNTTKVNIGRSAYSAGRGHDGELDEIRLHTAVRGDIAAFCKADHQNQIDDILTWSAEENAPAGNLNLGSSMASKMLFRMDSL
jgi:hypothetical protein